MKPEFQTANFFYKIGEDKYKVHWELNKKDSLSFDIFVMKNGALLMQYTEAVVIDEYMSLFYLQDAIKEIEGKEIEL